MYRQLVLCCLVGMAMRAQGGDLKLTTATHTVLMEGHTQDFEQTLIIHDQRSRGLGMRFTSSVGAPKSPAANVAIIQQCDARQQLLVDFDNRVYSVHPFPGAMSKAQIDAALTRTKANPTQTETLTISTQVTDLNEQKMAFGRVLRHYKIHSSRVASPGANTQSSEEDADGWFVEIPEYDQLSGCYSFAGHRGKASAIGFVTVSNGPMNYRIVRQSSGPLIAGYPADVTRTTTNFVKMPNKTARAYTTNRTEKITGLSTAPLDPALFDVPPGFTKVAEVEVSPTPSWNYRAQIAWAKLLSLFSH